MADGARSDDPAVQKQLDRLSSISPGRDILGLERITALLNRVGNPQDSLPPVFHVAGTNGKGSTCAFLRAAIEAQGLKAHVYTSPHLVRFNERIRLAGRLIDDDALAKYLKDILNQSQDIAPSFFEVTTAAAFLAFSEIAADVCIIEVGLGGRLDATNIIKKPVATAIAALGIDHEGFLLSEEAGNSDIPTNPIARIAYEKAGIAKAGIPLVTQKYTDPVQLEIAKSAMRCGAQLIDRGELWDAAIYDEKLHYHDQKGKLTLPFPKLPGMFQADNAALAVAILRHQQAVTISDSALAAAMEWAKWPARLQKLNKGPLTGIMADADIWLDGGHNPNAGAAIGKHFAAFEDESLHLIIGMLDNKEPAALIQPLSDKLASITVVPVADHGSHKLADFQSCTGETRLTEAENVADALSALKSKHPVGHRPQNILIAGSLYLAGDILKANEEEPD